MFSTFAHIMVDGTHYGLLKLSIIVNLLCSYHSVERSLCNVDVSYFLGKVCFLITQGMCNRISLQQPRFKSIPGFTANFYKTKTKFIFVFCMALSWHHWLFTSNSGIITYCELMINCWTHLCILFWLCRGHYMVQVCTIYMSHTQHAYSQRGKANTV